MILRNRFNACTSSFQKGNARYIFELHEYIRVFKDFGLFMLLDIENYILFLGNFCIHVPDTPLRHIKQGEPKPWEQCGSPDSVISQYLSSFYFIIYTMMTVGYGDQHADPSSVKVSEYGSMSASQRVGYIGEVDAVALL